jgi:hypothetical protein
MIHRLFLISIGVGLLAACTSASAVVTAPPTSAISARHETVLYWRPDTVDLKPGKGSHPLAKLWFSPNVVLYFDSYCKSMGVNFDRTGHGQRGRLQWNRYRFHTLVKGPFTCYILGLDEADDSIEANLTVNVSQ